MKEAYVQAGIIAAAILLGSVILAGAQPQYETLRAGNGFHLILNTRTGEVTTCITRRVSATERIDECQNTSESYTLPRR